MAADTAVWQGQIIVGYRQKIVRLRDGRLLACAGPLAMAAAVESWLNDADIKPWGGPDDDFQALLLSDDGVLCLDARMRSYPSPTGQFHVAGSHIEFLFGAMAAGSSAEQAVRLAIEYGDSAGGEVQVERVAVANQEDILRGFPGIIRM